MKIIILVLFILNINKSYQQQDFEISADPGPYGGQVNVYIEGVVKPICDDSMNQQTANVLCEILGYGNYGDETKNHGYDVAQSCINGVSSFNANNVICNGGETSISQCAYNSPVEDGYCSNEECFTVSCKNFKCDQQQADSMGCVTCIGEQGVARSRIPPDCDCPENFSDFLPTDDSCRANNEAYTGSVRTDTVLEFYYNDEWKGVCDDQFTEAAALVACKQLGFTSIKIFEISQDCGSVNGYWLDGVTCNGEEENLSQCQHNDFGDNDCSSTECIRLECGQISPVMNPGAYDGQFNMNFDGVVKPVCDDEFNQNAANVVCRQLGYDNFSNFDHGYLTGQNCLNGESDFNMDDIVCNGSESNITQCQYNTNHNCGSTECVTLQCKNYRCSVQTASSMQCTTCIGDAGLEYSRQIPDCECPEGFNDYYPQSENCQASVIDGSIRMGSEVGDVLQFYYNQQWRPFCDDDFNDEAAQVVCRQLGFTTFSGFQSSQTCPTYDDDDETPKFWIDNIRCNGDENFVTQCTYNELGQNDCSTSECLKITCTNTNEGQNDFLLQALDSPRNGQINVMLNGKSHPICDDDFDINDANVICKQLGYKFFEGFNHEFMTDQTCLSNDGAFNMDDLQCVGTEENISQCPYSPEHNCGSEECVKIQCRNYACASYVSDSSMDCATCIGNDEQTVEEKKRIGTSCHCPEGLLDLYPDEDLCQGLDDDYNGKIRVENSELLEFHYKGKWRPVCDDNFDEFDATVACRQLGFNSYQTFELGQDCEPAKIVEESEHNDPTENFEFSFWVDNVNCVGSEEQMRECRFNTYGTHDCDEYECVRIVCTNVLDNNGAISFHQTSDNSQGIVQISHTIVKDGSQIFSKKNICDKGLDDAMASVMCRELGFDTFTSYFGHQKCPNQDEIVQVDGEIHEMYWIGWSICTGEENRLQYCRKPYGWYGAKQSKCGINQCVLLQCGYDYQDNFLDGSISIENGGIVEVLHDGRWGQVCITDITMAVRLADVVCRTQGQITKKVGLPALYNRGYYGDLDSDEINYNLEIQGLNSDEELQGVFDSFDGLLAEYLLQEEFTYNEKFSYCPDFQNYWLQNVDCRSGKENSLDECQLNQDWGSHNCNSEMCLYVQCQDNPEDTPAEEITSTAEFQDPKRVKIPEQQAQVLQKGNVKLTDDNIIMVWGGKDWYPLIDIAPQGELEFSPDNHIYGLGMDKNAAHVVCKSLGYATYSTFQKGQQCPSDTDLTGGLGNISCNGQEKNLLKCYNLGWGRFLEGSTMNHCISIECSTSTCVTSIKQDQTTTTTNRLSTSQFPFCECAQGYYDGGMDQTCVQCDTQCEYCVFESYICGECSSSHQKIPPGSDEEITIYLLTFQNLDPKYVSRVQFVNKYGVMEQHDDIRQPDWRSYQCRYCNIDNGYIVKTDLDPNNPFSIQECEKCNSKCKTCTGNPSNCTACKGTGQPPNCLCDDGYTLDAATGFCEPCPAGRYNLDASTQECTQCINDVVCEGANVLNVNAGFWRLNSTSDVIVECVNSASSCKGGIDPFQTKQCAEGHVGALCEACDIEGKYWGEPYANSADYSCGKCSTVSGNAIKIIVISLFQFISMYLAVGGTITAIQEKMRFNCLQSLFNTQQPTPDEKGVLIKILINYLFLFGVLATFKLDVPDDLQIFQSNISNPTKNMSYSFDCFLIDVQTAMPNVYFKVIWQGLIVVMQLVLVFILFFILKITKQTKTDAKTFILTTIMYQFISQQPALNQMVIENIACRKIGDFRYMLSDTSRECSGDYYLYLVLMILFLIGLSFVIPLLIMFFMRLKATRKYSNSVSGAKEMIKSMFKRNSKKKGSRKMSKRFSKRKLNVVHVEEVKSPVKESQPKQQKQESQSQSGENENSQSKQALDNRTADQTKRENVPLKDPKIENIQKDNEEVDSVVDIEKMQNTDNYNSTNKDLEMQEKNNLNLNLKYDNKINSNDKMMSSNYQSSKIGGANNSDDEDEDDTKLLVEDIAGPTQIQENYQKKYNDVLINKQTNLDLSSTLGSFGYLYMEYNKKAYLWEFVKIYQRLLISLILGFYYEDIKVKGVLIFLVIFFYAIFAMRNKPYKLEIHNKIDMQSQVISGVTLILGLFLYDNDYTYWFVFGVVVISIINMYFMINMIQRLFGNKVRQFLTQVSDMNEKIEQQEELVKQQKERKRVFQELNTIKNNYRDQRINQEEGKQQVEEKLRELRDIDNIINSLDMVEHSHGYEQPEIPLALQDDKVDDTVTNRHRSQSNNTPKNSARNGVNNNNQASDIKKSTFADHSAVANKSVNIKVTQTFKTEEERKQEEKQLRMQKKLIKIVGFFEKFASKYFGYPSQQILRTAKYQRRKMKSILTNILIKGSWYGYMYLQDEEISVKDQEKKENGQVINTDPSKKFNSTTLFKGLMSQKELKSLKKEIQKMHEAKNVQLQDLLSQVSVQVAKILQDHGIDKKYYSIDEDAQIDLQNVDEVNFLTKNLDKLKVEEYLKSFVLFDPNHQQVITKDQFSKIMKNLGQNLSQNELDDMMGQVDANGDGTMDFCEFISLIQYSNLRKPRFNRETNDIYSWFNKFSDGLMTVDDLNIMYENLLNESVDERVLLEIIRQIDEDGDDKLTLYEFKKLLL